MNYLLILSCLLGQLTGLADDKKDPKALQLSDDEKAILELTNAERAKEKIPPLAPNALLFQAARGHSANMAKKGEMKHILDGKDVVARLDDAGYDFRKCGENIAASDGAALKEIMKNWMESKGHREHILDPAYTEIGVGTARNDKGDIYYTQDFGVPFAKP